MSNSGRNMTISSQRKKRKKPMEIIPLAKSFVRSDSEFRSVISKGNENNLSSSAPSASNLVSPAPSAANSSHAAQNIEKCEENSKESNAKKVINSPYANSPRFQAITPITPSPPAFHTRKACEIRKTKKLEKVQSTKSTTNQVFNPKTIVPPVKAAANLEYVSTPKPGPKNLYNSISVSQKIEYTEVIPEVVHGKLPPEIHSKALEFISTLPEPLVKDAPGKMGARREWLFGPYTYRYSGRSVPPSAPFEYCSDLCSSMAKSLGIQVPNALLLVHYPSGTTGLSPHRDDEPAHASEQVLTFCLGAPARIVLYNRWNEATSNFTTVDGSFYLFRSQRKFKHGVQSIPASESGRWAFTFRIFKAVDPHINSFFTGSAPSSPTKTKVSEPSTVQLSKSHSIDNINFKIGSSTSGVSDSIFLSNQLKESGGTVSSPPFGFSGAKTVPTNPGAPPVPVCSSPPSQLVIPMTNAVTSPSMSTASQVHANLQSKTLTSSMASKSSTVFSYKHLASAPTTSVASTKSSNPEPPPLTAIEVPHRPSNTAVANSVNLEASHFSSSPVLIAVNKLSPIIQTPMIVPSNDYRSPPALPLVLKIPDMAVDSEEAPTVQLGNSTSVQQNRTPSSSPSNIVPSESNSCPYSGSSPKIFHTPNFGDMIYSSPEIGDISSHQVTQNSMNSNEDSIYNDDDLMFGDPLIQFNATYSSQNSSTSMQSQNSEIHSQITQSQPLPALSSDLVSLPQLPRAYSHCTEIREVVDNNGFEFEINPAVVEPQAQNSMRSEINSSNTDANIDVNEVHNTAFGQPSAALQEQENISNSHENSSNNESNSRLSLSMDVPPLISQNSPTRTDNSNNNISHQTGFPGFTTRVGQVLKIVFPIVGPLECTEKPCTSSFCAVDWTAKKHSLIRHLEQYHNIIKPAVERWCSFCQDKMPVKIKTHSCFRDSQYCPVSYNDTDLPFKCDRCDYGATHISGIRSHWRIHIKEDAIASRITNIQNSSNQDINSAAQEESQNSSQMDLDSLPDTQQSTQTNTQVETLESDAEQGPVDMPVEDETEDLIADPDAPSPSDPFIEKFKNLITDFSPENFSAFEDLVNEFISFAQEHVGLPPVREGTNTTQNPNDPIYIQRLYRRNRRRAVRQILDDQPTQCEVNTHDLIQKFFADSDLTPDLSIFDTYNRAENTPDASAFTSTEVHFKLRNAENTAPGPDRLTYHHLRGVDTDAKVLTLIYNLCLKFKRIPGSWKTSRTIFIPKKGDDLTSAENWRPVALSSTIYKLYAGLLTKRLTKWIDENNVLSPFQKGFRPFDGTIENNYLLQNKIRKSRLSKRDICLLLIDFKNAFGSVLHSTIPAALSAAGAGSTYTEIIQNLYEESHTCLLTAEGVSDPIDVTVGVKQGCPLSGLIFNLVIDPILKKVQNDRSEYHVLGYADDIVVLEDSPENLFKSLQTIHKSAAQIGLTLNPKKCQTAHFSPQVNSCLGTEFSVDSVPIPIIKNFDPVSYLGKPIGFNLFPDSRKMDKFIDTGVTILNSWLAPWQKIDALKCFFFPSLNYAMRTDQFGKEQWARLDRTLYPLIRDTLGLTEKASREYVYGNSKDGLFGVPLAGEDSDIARVDTAFKLLMSADPLIRNCAWTELAECVKERTLVDSTPEEQAQYLSSERYGQTTNSYTSVWSHARAASGRLGISWQIAEDLKVTILKGETIITDKTKIFKQLRSHFRSERSSALGQKPHQGKTLPCYSAEKCSFHFNRNGDYLRFTDWKFVHQARLGTVKLNAYEGYNNNQIKSCRKCGYEKETLPHVLNHCKTYFPLRTKRHNKIVDRLKNAAKGQWEVYCENSPIGREGLRPDLILRKDDEALIIDVTVSFENGLAAFDRARNEKISKYTNLANELRHRFRKVTLDAVVVGSLGSWDTKNNKIIKRLCSRKYANLMKKLIVSDTIRSSRDIFMEHITGIRQYDNRSRYGKRIPPSTEENSNTESRESNPNSNSNSAPITDQTDSDSTAQTHNNEDQTNNVENLNIIVESPQDNNSGNSSTLVSNCNTNNHDNHNAHFNASNYEAINNQISNFDLNFKLTPQTISHHNNANNSSQSNSVKRNLTSNSQTNSNSKSQTNSTTTKVSSETRYSTKNNQVPRSGKQVLRKTRIFRSSNYHPKGQRTISESDAHLQNSSQSTSTSNRCHSTVSNPDLSATNVSDINVSTTNMSIANVSDELSSNTNASTSNMSTANVSDELSANTNASTSNVSNANVPDELFSRTDASTTNMSKELLPHQTMSKELLPSQSVTNEHSFNQIVSLNPNVSDELSSTLFVSNELSLHQLVSEPSEEPKGGANTGKYELI